MTMSWVVLLFLCSWWRWCRGSRLWSLFPFLCCFYVTSPCFFRFLSSLHSHSTSHFKLLCILSFLSLCSLFSCSNFSPSPSSRAGVVGIYRAKGSGGVPIATLWQRMGSRALLPCHSAGLAGQ